MFQPFVSKEYSARYLSVASLISKAFWIELVEESMSSTYFFINILNTSCSMPVHFVFNNRVVLCMNTFDSRSDVVVVLQLTSQIFIEFVDSSFALSVRVLLRFDSSPCILFMTLSWSLVS